MKIITINLPESYLKAVDSLVGNEYLYPSRSEAIRVAVREFLIKELEAAKAFQSQFANFKQSGSACLGSGSAGDDDFSKFLKLQPPKVDHELTPRQEKMLEYAVEQHKNQQKKAESVAHPDNPYWDYSKFPPVPLQEEKL